DGRLVYGEETQGLVFHNPHRTGMDVEQHPVALFAVFQILQPARLFGDVLSDAVVPLEFPQRVENRLAGHAQVAHLALAVGGNVDEIAERFVTLKLVTVLLPDLFRERRQSWKLPARFADEYVLAETAFFHAGQIDEAEILVLHPVPVGAHVDHAAKPGFARLERLLRELDLRNVVNQRNRALRRTRAVPDQRARDPHPHGRAVLGQIALFIDARLGRRQELVLEIPRRLPIVVVGYIFEAFLQ